MAEAKWYTPPAALEHAEHLKKPHKRDWQGQVPERYDCYTGTAGELSAAGLLPLDMFPGQPGRGVARATYRPLGVTKAKSESWWNMTGYMEVIRNLSGTFTILITVSKEERERRAALNAAEWERRKLEEEATERARVDRAAAAALAEHPVPTARPRHLRLVWSAA